MSGRFRLFGQLECLGRGCSLRLLFWLRQGCFVNICARLLGRLRRLGRRCSQRLFFLLRRGCFTGRGDLLRYLCSSRFVGRVGFGRSLGWSIGAIVLPKAILMHPCATSRARLHHLGCAFASWALISLAGRCYLYSARGVLGWFTRERDPWEFPAEIRDS